MSGKIWETILEFVFPSSIYCINCGNIIDKSRSYALCDHCIEKFHWLNGGRTCEKCGKLLGEHYRGRLCYDCMARERHFDKGYTCAQYGLYERSIMMKLKYGGKSHIGVKLGDVLYDRWMLTGEHADLIVPVPMFRIKENKRGYNQAAIMAKRLSKRSRIPFYEMIIRKKNTEPMRNLGSIDRYENIREAFSFDTSYDGIPKGETVLLIDDIFTTGSTLDACSRIMKEQGAKKVIVLTFAAGVNVSPKN